MARKNFIRVSRMCLVVVGVVETLVALSLYDNNTTAARVSYTSSTQFLSHVEELQERDTRDPWNDGKFFQDLYGRTGRCLKLASVGGLGCLRRLEGNKFICLDDDVVPPRGRCLVYSFGVAGDTTFEDDIDNLFGCEIHMFDPTVSASSVLNNQDKTTRKHQHFHAVGLSHRLHRKISGSSFTHSPDKEQFRTLPQIMEALGHENATLHLLKMDIEGSEWKVLQSLRQDGTLDRVGQLVVEIHVFDLFNVSSPHPLNELKERHEILQGLEDSGFRRVHSVNNTFLPGYRFVQSLGEDVPMSLELLYVRRPTIS